MTGIPGDAITDYPPQHEDVNDSDIEKIRKMTKKLYGIVLGIDMQMKNPMYELHSAMFIRGLMTSKGLSVANGEEELTAMLLFDEYVDDFIEFYNKNKERLKLDKRNTAEGLS